MVGVQSGKRLRQLGALFTCGAIGHKTDAELLDLFAQRDDREHAFEALVVRHGPLVLRACRRILADPNDADDAFQATFLILAHRADSGSIGRPDALGSWLYGVALRVARKARVAAARRRRHEQQVGGRLDGDWEDRHDIMSVIREEVDRLPEPLRRPVVLCYLEEMTYQAAARLLCVSEDTIRGRLVKARGLLRVRLSRRTGVEPARCRDTSKSRPPASGVSPALIAATIRAARTLTPGGVGSLGISAAVAELMEGVLTMMLVTRWMVCAEVVAVLGIAAAGGIALAAKDPDDKTGVARVSESGPPAPSVEVPNAKPPGDKMNPTAPSVKVHPENVMTLETAIGRLMNHLPADAARREITMAVADILTVNLRANPPDVSHKRPARTRSGRVAKTVTEAQFQDAVRNQIDHLYSVFVDVQAAQEKARPDRESLAFSWRFIRTNQKRGEEKTAEGNPFRSSLIAYERTRQSLLNTEENLGRTRKALTLMLALPVAEANRLEVEEMPRARSIPSLDRMIRLALETRSDLIALRLGLERTQTEMNEATRRRIAESDMYTLDQPYSSQGLNMNGVKSATSWALGVTVPLPIYSRNQGEIERAKINLQQSRLQIAAAERQIKSQVERCHRECQSSLLELADLQKEKWAASWDRDAALRHYEAGEIGVDEVMNAIHKSDEIELRCVEVLVKHRRSTLALNTAVGMRILP